VKLNPHTPCANCEHVLHEHPPDAPCCSKCMGWISHAQRCAQLEAQCAAMREAIQTHSECVTVCDRCGHETPNSTDDVCRALASSAGKALLERLEKAERLVTELRCTLDGADCTQREGGDTRHCRVDKLCWRCRAEKAERELETRYAETTPDEIQALRKAGPDVMLAEILRYRNMLGRAMHNTEKAFAECAELVRSGTWSPTPDGVSIRDFIAQAIRAKAGGT
jgi:hypothetical protein